MNTSVPPADSKAVSGVFLATIAAMNDGKVLDDIDDALRNATRAAIDCTAKAKITIELTIVPNGEGAGGTPLIKILDRVTTKLPLKERPKQTVFFADENCNPTRRNPGQEKIEFSTVDGGKAPALKDAPRGVAAAASS